MFNAIFQSSAYKITDGRYFNRNIKSTTISDRLLLSQLCILMDEVCHEFKTVLCWLFRFERKKHLPLYLYLAISQFNVYALLLRCLCHYGYRSRSRVKLLRALHLNQHRNSSPWEYTTRFAPYVDKI